MARGSPLIEALNDCMHNLIRNASVESPHYTIKANPISFTTIVKYVGEITDGRENQRALEDGVIFSEKHCAIIQRDPDLTPNELVDAYILRTRGNANLSHQDEDWYNAVQTK
jgi:hypothetical protein